MRPQHHSDSPSARLPQLLTEREVAEILGLSVKTLRNWRIGRSPLPFLKISRAIRYSSEDVASFIARNRRASTSDVGVLDD